MEQTPHPFHDRVDPRRADLGQLPADHAEIAHGNVYAVLGGDAPFQKHGEDLQAQQLVDHAPVEEVAKEGQRRRDGGPVAEAVVPPERQHGPVQQQLAHLRELRADHPHQARVGRGVVRAGEARAEEAAAEYPPATEEVGILE